MKDTLPAKPKFSRKNSAVNTRPSFSRKADPHADLLAETVENSTGNPEIDAAEQEAAMLAALNNKELKKAIADKIKLTTDSEYWAAVCFETRAQKEAFLKALDVFRQGDKYLDGLEVARRMGIELPSGDFPYRSEAKPDKKLNALSGGY